MFKQGRCKHLYTCTAIKLEKLLNLIESKVKVSQYTYPDDSSCSAQDFDLQL